MTDQCPFCQLIRSGQVLQIHENETAVAFLDINPRARGHAIIAPKDHVQVLPELSAQQHADLMAAAATVAEKAGSTLDADGVSIVLNDGETAGQRIPHVYLQVFPRYRDEENAGVPAGAVFQPVEMSENDLKATAEKLAAATASTPSSTRSTPPPAQPQPQPGNPSQEVQAADQSEPGEEEAFVDLPMDAVRKNTEMQRSKPVKPEKSAAKVRNAAEQEKQQKQQQEVEEAYGGAGPEPVNPKTQGAEPRFTTDREIPEDYPSMDHIKVKRGVDLGKYASHKLEVNARVFQDYAEVELREGGHETRFTLDETNERAIVHDVAKHFKLDPELVAERINFEYVKFEERSVIPSAGYEDYEGDDTGHDYTAGGKVRTRHDNAEFV